MRLTRKIDGRRSRNFQLSRVSESGETEAAGEEKNLRQLKNCYLSNFQANLFFVKSCALFFFFAKCFLYGIGYFKRGKRKLSK